MWTKETSTEDELKGKVDWGLNGLYGKSGFYTIKKTKIFNIDYEPQYGIFFYEIFYIYSF
jgi:hypothetical protein